MELQGNILELLAPETRTFKSPNTGEDVEYTSRVLLLDCSTYNRFGDPIENIVPITFTGRYAEVSKSTRKKSRSWLPKS